jgi:hypothetical protein
MKSFLIAICLGTALFAQENRFEIGAAATGNFMRSLNGNGVSHGVDDRAGVGASFRYWLTGRQGVDISWSYSNPFHSYNSRTAGGAFRMGMNEATASYVYRLPTFSKRLQPFALAGVGALVFNPDGSVVGTSTVAKAAFVYGGGLDAYLSRHIGLRMQYKGFVLGDPNAGTAALATSRTNHIAQPSAGLFWRF